jgi:flavin-dependent dehydrogenase
MVDVIIVGGGIAGSSLAVQLGRRGLRVELHDRARFPREKTCGEGLMPGGVAALRRLGLDEAIEGAPFLGVRYHTSGHVSDGRFPDVPGLPAAGLGIRRLRFDAALLRAAAATGGVRVFTEAAVEGPVIENGRVAGIRVNGAEKRAALVVAADGMHSRLRRRLGLDMPARRKRIGMRCHFRLAPGQNVPQWVHVFVERGYELYVTPLPRRELLVAALADAAALHESAAAAFGRWRNSARELAALLDGAAQISDVECAAPLSGQARRGHAPGIVLLGDAAGFTDPITGGGMTQALTTAELLASRIAEGALHSDGWIEGFERERARLLRDFRLLTAATVWLARHPALARRVFASLRHCPSLFSRFVGVSAGMCGLLPFSWRGEQNPADASFHS